MGKNVLPSRGVNIITAAFQYMRTTRMKSWTEGHRRDEYDLPWEENDTNNLHIEWGAMETKKHS